MLALIVACVKDLEKEGIYTETEIIGTVVEKSANTPLADIKVSITDGDHIHASATTGSDGTFRMKANFSEMNENYYLLLDGSPNLPSKQEELRGMGSEYYDYKMLVLYDKTDTNLLPQVTTGEASNILGHTATVKGTVSFSGGKPLTGRGVCYATHQSPTISDSCIAAGMEVGVFNCNLSGLQTSTIYYYRAYATNSIGISYGEQKSFTTTDGLPSVTTTTPTNILATTAQGGGNVAADGGSPVTARGICWNETGNPTIDDPHTTNGTGNGSFTATMTELTLGTTYRVRAYATNSDGTGYGAEKTFTTTNGLPTVTVSIASFTASDAALHGNVTNDNGSAVTERGFCWSTSQNPTVSGSHISAGTGTGTFSGSITNLTANTIYYVRAYATNSYGTSYSSQLSFTTTNGLPIVITSATTISDITVSSGGNVTSDGGFPVTARGVCYGSLPYPDLTSTYSHTTDGTGTGYFSSSFTLPDDVTTCYVRAYATNATGTSYGEQTTVTPAYAQLPTFSYNGHTYRVAPNANNLLAWSDANNYCNNLTLYGYSDWVMPTKSQLLQMYNDRYSIGGFNTSSSSSSRKYWSCTYYVSGSSHEYIYVDFSNGASATANTNNSLMNVRPIRMEE